MHDGPYVHYGSEIKTKTCILYGMTYTHLTPTNAQIYFQIPVWGKYLYSPVP